MQEIITILKTAVLPLPAFEIAALLGFLSVCLVCKLTRLGLVAAYGFAYRWGWLVFAEKGEDFLLWYLIFGMAVGVLTVIGMLLSPAGN